LDAIDILVNLHKRTGYRPRAVRYALRKALSNVLNNQTGAGGFVYQRKRQFMHMGIEATYTPPDTPEMFSTWFRTHGVALACQILSQYRLAGLNWRFNNILSMGWHDSSIKTEIKPDPWQDRLPIPRHWFQVLNRKFKGKFFHQSLPSSK
jgi:hypothetical protein